jgi:hypothetical protein
MPWPLATRARNLAACGYTGAEVAAELGVSSRQYLYQLVGALGLPRGRRPDADIEAAVMDGLGKGVRPQRLAAFAGCSRATVWKALRRLEAAALVEHAGRGAWRPTEKWVEVRPCECQRGRRHQHGRAKA